MALPAARSTLHIIGGSSSFNYLIRRYAERVGYLSTAMPVSATKETIGALQPAAVIFSSLESFADSEFLVRELENIDIPIIVCSSVADQRRARELGADYCLLHPFAYDDFSAILATIASQSLYRSG